MSNGLLGALDQYFSIEPKARLHKRNTYFDARMSNSNALKVGIVVSSLATAIIIFWSLIGVIL